MKSEKCVVIVELPDTGYIECIAICDGLAEAFGKAYSNLTDGISDEGYHISIPQDCEGRNGYIMELTGTDGKIDQRAIILFYPSETETLQS